MVICTSKGDILPDLKQQNEQSYLIEPPNLEKEIHILRAQQAPIDYRALTSRVLQAPAHSNISLEVPIMNLALAIQMITCSNLNRQRRVIIVAPWRFRIVMGPAVSTQLWLDRLQKCDFDVFGNGLRRAEWKLSFVS